ncbi:pentapeptide repeat protein [Hymenobacter roseosalivarius DSM 11622]|uniref:Pentapeptide repeat protein n=1 Tax=Hymenobacter roseosalivarius DSM 11622 TaxID=645990 RepID=A0A1W1VLF4_9BACT|nr:pentapeptide repeat-containing protein [Hymenobacter roseosalivarius]SMB94158.1 pentapeptide repeat protein [Hymenobacter roseosalivarius DSM 11622]
MKPRRTTAAARKPIIFLAENVFERWTAAEIAPQQEMEQYRFVAGNFSGADLTNKRFIDCRFEQCNLSLVTLAGAGLQNVEFSECKLSGVQFSACRELGFEVGFAHCQLPYASFHGKRLRGTRFAHCVLTEADFSYADMTEAVFQECTLTGAIFEQTQLVGADFTTASGFLIDPEINAVKKARFSLEGLPGLLSKHEIVVE